MELILKLERISKRLSCFQSMTKLGLAITAGPLLFCNYFSKALKARSIAGLNGFLRQTGKEPTTYQEVQWANKSSCTYIHTYNFAAYLRTVEHFWLFSKTLGELWEFQWLSSPNRQKGQWANKSSCMKIVDT